jgi:hypothetical protein
MRFDAPKAVNIKNKVFWEEMPCCLVNIYQGFGEIIIFLFSEL